MASGPLTAGLRDDLEEIAYRDPDLATDRGEVPTVVWRGRDHELRPYLREFVDAAIGHRLRNVGIGEAERRTGRSGERPGPRELATLDPGDGIEDAAGRLEDPEVAPESGRVVEDRDPGRLPWGCCGPGRRNRP
jgi:hypothetical protein